MSHDVTCVTLVVMYRVCLGTQYVRCHFHLMMLCAQLFLSHEISQSVHLVPYLLWHAWRDASKGREGAMYLMWYHFYLTLCLFLAQGDGPKGQFAVEQLRIVEVLPPYTFGKEYMYLFQVC